MNLLMIQIADVHPNNLRNLFYAEIPIEATYTNVNDVPEYLEKVAN